MTRPARSRRPAPGAAVGVICPSRFEYEAIRDLAVEAHAAVVVSGMGKVRAACAVHSLARKHPGLRRILLIGFAGGLSGLRIGDVIEPRLVVEQDYCAEPFEKFPNQVRLTGKRLVPGSRAATLLTQDRFIKGNPYANSPFVRRHPRIACDMEAYAVVWAARELGLKCSVIKLISDEADSKADHDFLKACRDLRPRLRDLLVTTLRKLRS